MKYLIFIALFSSISVFAGPKKEVKKHISKKVVSKNKTLEMIEKKTEDCDEKAKKKVEIKPESISLSGNAGCSLDEAH